MILFIELNVDSERGLNRHWRGGDGMSGKDSHDVHVSHTHLSYSLQKLPVSLGPLASLEWWWTETAGGLEGEEVGGVPAWALLAAEWKSLRC